MAEIYKQQVEYTSSGGKMLQSAPFRRYFEQGLDDVNHGFKQLDEYLEYLGDKELASRMQEVAQSASNKIDSWKNFNTEGRDALLASIMDEYDQNYYNAAPATQRRFNQANPEARKIFELKAKEDILKKARTQIVAEKKRSLDDIAVEISQVEDPVENEKAWIAAKNDRVTQDPTDMIGTVEMDEIVDSFDHNVAKRTILKALADGRASAAESYLKNPLYVGRLGPDEYQSMRNSLETLIKNQEELKASGGDAKQFADGLFMFRDWLQLKAKIAGEDPVTVDQGWQRFITAIQNGQPIEDVYIKDRRVTDLITESEIQALRYLDSLPPSTIQLGINEYNKKMKDVFPEYSFKQDEAAQQFLDYVGSLKIKDSNGSYDTRLINNEQDRTLRRLIEELDSLEYGMDSSLLKEKNLIKMALDRKDDRVAKTLSVQNWPLKQERQGIWKEIANPAEYVGLGNITEAMVNKAEKGEEVDFFETLFEHDTGRYDSDLAHDIAEAALPVMLEAGEVNKEGKLVVPKSNSYRYMSYVIPIMFSGESVFGRQDMREKVGIKTGLNEGNTYALVKAIQQYYVDKGVNLDDPVDTYNSFWSNKKMPEQGQYTTDSPDISRSELFNMIMDVHGQAISLGLAEEKAPDRSIMLELAHTLRNIAAADTTLQSIGRTFDKTPSLPRNDSAYYKRINELTPRAVTRISND